MKYFEELVAIGPYAAGMRTPVDLASVRRWHPYSWSRTPFKPLTWTELLGRFEGMAERYPEQLAMVDILDSLIGSDVVHRLAGSYTISGLHVVSVEDREPPYSVITVATYGWGRTTKPLVEISHMSTSGLREEVVRPVDGAVPLFWRFVSVKFAICPTSSGTARR